MALLIILTSPALAQVTGPKLRALPMDTRCPVELPGTSPGGGWAWSKQERWAWRQICLGRVADMRLVSGGYDGEKCNPVEIESDGGTVPANRILRPEFLGLIVNAHPWAAAPAKPQLQIHCADFPRRLDLSNQTIKAELNVFGSRLRGGANLRGARFARNLNFANSHMGGRLSATALEVKGDVILSGGASFTEIEISRARISGDADISDATVTGAITANRLRVDGAIFVRNSSFTNLSLKNAVIEGSHEYLNTTVSGVFGGSGLKVNGDLTFDGSQLGVLILDDALISGDMVLRQPPLNEVKAQPVFAISGEFSGERMVVSGDMKLDALLLDSVNLPNLDLRHNLFLNPEIVVEGDFVMPSASVHGDAVLDSVSLNGMFDATNAVFHGRLAMNNTRLSDLLLSGARISKHFNAAGTSLTGAMELDGLQALGEIDLSGLRASGDVSARALNAGDRLVLNGVRASELDLTKAQVRGDVEIENGVFYDDLIANEITVAGDVSLAGSKLDGALRARDASVGGELDLSRFDAAFVSLRNASADRFHTRIEAWKSKEAWTAGDLLGFHYSSLRGAEQGLGTTLADRSHDVLADWIMAIQPVNQANRFPEAVFDQLSNVLEREGMNAKARDLQYAKLTHRNAFAPSDAEWYKVSFLWPVSRWLVGYGIYPYRITYPLIIFVIVGGILAYQSRETTLRSSIIRSFLYSVDNALPVIELRDAHKEMDLGYSWMDTFFLIQKLLGAIVVAVVTGTVGFLAVT